MKYLLAILGVLLAVVVLAPKGTFKPEVRPPVVLSDATKREIQQEARKRAQIASEGELEASAKAKVLATLKEPESAQFRDCLCGDSPETGPAWFGWVNAKNSLGGYTGFQRFICNGRTVLFEKEHAKFSEAWGSLAVQRLQHSPAR